MELGALAESGSKVLGSRTFVNVLPPALLSVIVFALLAAGAPGTPSAAELTRTLQQFDGAQVALLLVAILVIAVILQPFQIAVVQLLEGYWFGNPLTRSDRPTLAHKLSAMGIELQRRRYRYLRLLREDPDARRKPRPDQLRTGSTAVWEASLLAGLRASRSRWANAEFRHFPEEQARLMPTRLGNVLRAAEDRAGGRYGLATNVVYPRLYSLLSDRLAMGLAGSNQQLDLAAHLCVTLVVVTLASAGLLLPNGWRSPWWLLVPLATAALAWLSYRAAIRAARAQGRLLETAFDLHRFDLLAALHYRLPDDPWSEYEFNSAVSTFLATAQQSTRRRERGGGALSLLLPDDYEHPGSTTTAQDGTASRGSGPFQPFRWDWDTILGNGGGSKEEDAGRPEHQGP